MSASGRLQTVTGNPSNDRFALDTSRSPDMMLTGG